MYQDEDVQVLLTEIARLRKALHNTGDYVPQDIALDCLTMLETTGFGKEGTSNTLFGMVQQACEEVKRLRVILATCEEARNAAVKHSQRLAKVIHDLNYNR